MVSGHNATLQGYITLGTTWVNDINFGMNNVPGAESFDIGLHSSVLPLWLLPKMSQSVQGWIDIDIENSKYQEYTGYILGRQKWFILKWNEIWVLGHGSGL